MNKVFLSIVSTAGLIAASSLGAFAADSTQVRPGELRARSGETYTLTRSINQTNSNGIDVVVLEPAGVNDGFGRISVDRSTAMARAILDACPEGTTCKLNVSISNGTLGHVYSARQSDNNRLSDRTATRLADNSRLNDINRTAMLNRNNDRRVLASSSSTIRPSNLSSFLRDDDLLHGRVKEVTVDGQRMVVIEPVDNRDEASWISIPADADMAEEIRDMCPANAQCLFEVGVEDGNVVVHSVDRVRDASMLNSRTSMTTANTNLTTTNRPMPVYVSSSRAGMSTLDQPVVKRQRTTARTVRGSNSYNWLASQYNADDTLKMPQTHLPSTW